MRRRNENNNTSTNASNIIMMNTPITDVEAPAVIKGDSLSANIAAASVLAKVTRDDLMMEAAKTYPQYQFDIHKGYGTKAHYAALTEYGPCPIHRMTFLRKFYGEK